MKNLKENKCGHNDCQGWFLDQGEDGQGITINRCDQCAVFENDKAAAVYVSNIVKSFERELNTLTLENIWNAINNGQTVCWSSERYEVHPVESNGSDSAKQTERNGLALRCSCIDNYFGSLIDSKEFSSCFIVDKKPRFGGVK